MAGSSPTSLKVLTTMAELTEPQKLEIVEALACFRSTTEIIKHFETVHDLKLPHDQVGTYDPTRPYYKAGDKWREIFEARRKAYLEDVATVPNANQGFRLNELHTLYEKAKSAGNLVLAAQLLEQSAKEVGGVLTNQRDVRIDDSRRQRAADLTPEDRKMAIAELVRQVIESRAAGQLPTPVAASG